MGISLLLGSFILCLLCDVVNDACSAALAFFVGMGIDAHGRGLVRMAQHLGDRGNIGAVRDGKGGECVSGACARASILPSGKCLGSLVLVSV